MIWNNSQQILICFIFFSDFSEYTHIEYHFIWTALENIELCIFFKHHC